MDLASRDSYMQKFASKIITQRDQEPKKRPFGNVSSVFSVLTSACKHDCLLCLAVLAEKLI